MVNKVGTPGDDSNLFGTDMDDAIDALAGVDKLFGLGGNDTLLGGADNDYLNGGDGNDILNGGTGADTMEGGDGDDSYTVDDLGDIVIEQAGPNSGRDTVFAFVSGYTLADNVENLSLEGANGVRDRSKDIDGNGNASNNLIYGWDGKNTIHGNGGDDRIYAGGGNDTIFGDDGNDILDGGTGADRMTGGTGDDLFVVDSTGDMVIEAAGANSGIDKVASSITYFLGANVENLSLFDGFGDIDGYGNALNNIVVGNTSNNILFGYAGTDSLDGRAGNDNLHGGDGNDTLLGGAGLDFLNGGTGADTMNGGEDSDMYVVDQMDDIVNDTGSGPGKDTIFAYTDFALSDAVGVELLYLKGTANYGGGNEGDNYLIGNAANNTLEGKGGIDYLVGGGGNDRFQFSAPAVNGRDVIADFNAGDKLVFSASAYGGTTNANISQRFASGTTDTFAGTSPHFYFNTGTSTLFYDEDGAGTGSAAVALANFTQNGHVVSAGDFFFMA